MSSPNNSQFSFCMQKLIFWGLSFSDYSLSETPGERVMHDSVLKSSGHPECLLISSGSSYIPLHLQCESLISAIQRSLSILCIRLRLTLNNRKR